MRFLLAFGRELADGLVAQRDEAWDLVTHLLALGDLGVAAEADEGLGLRLRYQRRELP